MLSIIGCFDDLTDNPIGNRPPKTGIFLFPDSTVTRQPSKIKLAWWGDDPDGLVVGYYFTWDGVNWTFTNKNDSLFALQIGTVDTIYEFKVAAVDNGGNGVYDLSIVRNNINFGPEPFNDLNNNGVWDIGEPFIDIGLIDPNPATIKIPIRNSAPTISWNILTVIPDTSFPVMSFGWITNDIDGDATIAKINIALNDTSEANVVSIPGATRIITLRVRDFSTLTPLADILIEGSASNTHPEKLPGMILNGNNVFYVQAEDISGAKSPFIRIPGAGGNWFVQKPRSNFLIIDDYVTVDDAPTFYSQMMDSLNLTDKHDIYNFRVHKPPYLNVTFLETIKLFKYVLWYGDNSPSLDLASGTVTKYLDAGGKILMSTLFPQNLELLTVQGFLPMIRTDTSGFRTSISNAVVSAQNTQPSYPDLQTQSTLFRVRSFFLNEIGVIPIYYFPNNELPGYIGFSDSQKKNFFIGLPLHRLNGGQANVKQLLSKILFEEFGMTP